MRRIPLALILALVFTAAVVIIIQLSPVLPYYSSVGNASLALPYGTEWWFWASPKSGKVTVVSADQPVPYMVYGGAGTGVIVRGGDIPYDNNCGHYGFTYVTFGNVKAGYWQGTDGTPLFMATAVLVKDPSTGQPTYIRVVFKPEVATVNNTRVIAPILNGSAYDVMYTTNFETCLEYTGYVFGGFTFDWNNYNIQIIVKDVATGAESTFDLHLEAAGTLSQGQSFSWTRDYIHYTDNSGARVMHEPVVAFFTKVEFPASLQIEMSN